MSRVSLRILDRDEDAASDAEQNEKYARTDTHVNEGSTRMYGERPIDILGNSA